MPVSPSRRPWAAIGSLTIPWLVIHGLVGLDPAAAQTATMSLSPSPALWSDRVVAHVSGIGCESAAEPPTVSFASPNWVVDIDVVGCFGDPLPFAFDVELPELYPRRYVVRLQNGLRDVLSPPPPPFTTRELEVSRNATLQITLPAVATDAAPFAIELAAYETDCTAIEPPEVDLAARTITSEALHCLPTFPTPPGPTRAVYEVGPLQAGAYDIRFYDTAARLPTETTTPFVREQLIVHDSGRCVPDATTLCLGDGRFAVSTHWSTPLAGSGSGGAQPLLDRDDSGLFHFFTPDNVELTVKVLDGCGVNGAWWVFVAPGSNVAWTVRVEDTTTGNFTTYSNPQGTFQPLIHDTGAFTCP